MMPEWCWSLSWPHSRTWRMTACRLYRVCNIPCFHSVRHLSRPNCERWPYCGVPPLSGQELAEHEYISICGCQVTLCPSIEHKNGHTVTTVGLIGSGNFLFPVVQHRARCRLPHSFFDSFDSFDTCVTLCSDDWWPPWPCLSGAFVFWPFGRPLYRPWVVWTCKTPIHRCPPLLGVLRAEYKPELSSVDDLFRHRCCLSTDCSW